MTVPVPYQWSVGEEATSSKLNAGYEVDSWCIGGKPIFSIYATASRAISTSMASITFGAEEVDNAGGWSSSANPDRYTFQYPGRYWISGGIGWAGGDGGRRDMWYELNSSGSPILGSRSAVGTTTTPAGDTTSAFGLSLRTRLINVDAGDWIRLIGLSSVATNTNAGSTITSYLNGVWVSD